MNSLYYGDNLEILREHIADKSVDLIYLDPPFNSKRIYNVFFQSKTGKNSAAQIRAFEDTWHWTDETQTAFDEIMGGKYANDLKKMMSAFRQFMGNNNLMAYLTMMAIRLVELHRVLKNTGSLYLHCDPTASHYLKILLDQIFGIANFRNEITWKRTSAHNDPKRYGCNTDIIFFYTKGSSWTWNEIYLKHSPEYLKRFRNAEQNGRFWSDYDLTAKGLSGGGYEYEYKGVKSLWRVPLETMEELDEEGRLHFTRAGGIRLKRYLEDTQGIPLQSLWDDIPPINSQAKERMGYPTQKPIALLERIILVSSKEGDIVLDPFCGCGTAVVAAEKLGRQWLGIDITFDAVSLIEWRIRTQYPDIRFHTEGIPTSADDAAKLFKQSPIQFEKWAVYLIGGQPHEKKGGGDRGVDGLLFFEDKKGKWHRIIIEVKGGSYHPKDVRALKEAMNRDEAPLGVLIALEPPTKGMLSDIAAMGKWKMPGIEVDYPVLQIITIQEIFEGKKLDFPPIDTLKRAFRQIREKEKTLKLL
jgi:DNA modification methylase